MAILKDVRQFVCVFQDTEPPESSSISRKSTKVLGSIRRVQFTKATQRHGNIREKQRSVARKIRVKVLHQQSPYAPKFEDGSQQETERQERCVRGDAWRLAKKYPTAQRKTQSYLFLTYRGLVSPRAIRNKTGGKRIRRGFRSINAHVEQERPELCRIGKPQGSLKVWRRLLQPMEKCKQ